MPSSGYWSEYGIGTFVILCIVAELIAAYAIWAAYGLGDPYFALTDLVVATVIVLWTGISGFDWQSELRIHRREFDPAPQGGEDAKRGA